MRRKYSIGLLALLAAVAALAGPCPPALTGIAHEVAALRGVPAPFSPPCREIAPSALAGELDRKLRRDLPLEPHLFLEALRRTGFIDQAPAAVYPKLLDFYASQVLGFYEPASDEMVLVRRELPAGAAARLVWAHELAHAAQQHRFRLPSRLLAMRDDGDAQRAASAVAEGEAMLVMFLLEGGGSEALPAAERALAAQAADPPRPDGVPPYFVADLVFPYTGGFAAVLRAYRAGGWPAVDRMLAQPPQSTSVLLHPDRPPARPAELSPPPLPVGRQEVLVDTVGEWGLAFWLGRSLPRADAERIAATWSGDRIRLARVAGTDGAWALAWRLRCRDEAGSAALAAALRQASPARLAALAPSPAISITHDGLLVELRANW